MKHTTVFILSIFICLTGAQAARFDHFNVVVRDLDKTVSEMKSLGFKIKMGRPHGNGILNAFIKMSDRSYLELISVTNPTGDLSKYFARKLEEAGETPVFMSFEKSPLKQSGDMILNKGKYFSTMGYPLNHILRAYFLIDYHMPPNDSPYIDHENGVTGISELHGLKVPPESELNSQFLPIDPRVKFNEGSNKILVNRVVFSIKCDVPGKFTAFEKFQIAFEADKQCQVK